MRKSLFFLLLFFCTKAQTQNKLFEKKTQLPLSVTDFKLSDYKYRTPGFRSMVGRLVTNGLFANSGSKTDTGKAYSGNHQFSFNGSLDWGQLYNTDTRQHVRSYSAGSWIDRNGTKSPGMKTSDSRYFFGAGVSEQNTLYKDKYFIEVGGSFGMSATFSSMNSQDSKNNSSMLTPSISFNSGIGKGRLENVMDAQMALFLLDELQTKNMVRTKVSSETAYKFAELVTSLRNRRIFDYRVRRAYELTAIDSFLKANKMVSAYDIHYFTSINDVWSFAIQSPIQSFVPFATSVYGLATGNFGETMPGGYIHQLVRYSGTIRYLRLNAYTDWNIISTKSDSTKFNSSGSYKTAYLRAGIEKRVPINLNWQKNYTVEAGVTYAPFGKAVGAPTTPGTPPLPADSAKIPVATSKLLPSITAMYSIGYFPNTRTTVHMGAVSSISKSVFSGSGLSFSFGADLVTSYFINYNTRIGADIFIALTPVSKIAGTNSNSAQVRFNISYLHFFY